MSMIKKFELRWNIQLFTRHFDTSVISMFWNFDTDRVDCDCVAQIVLFWKFIQTNSKQLQMEWPI